MGIYRSVRAVAGASGDGAVDWAAVETAAQAAVDPGSVELTPAEQAAYATDVREARDRIRQVAGVSFDLPETVEVQNRHHWIETNVATFARLLRPLDDNLGLLPDVARVVNTGSMSASLAFLANNVLGQYDPLLLADGDEEHGLYVVHPNVLRVSEQLGVEFPRFRRWIAFHEVAHAAEFGAAPWLNEHLEASLQRGIAGLEAGRLDREALLELDLAMTAVEGYAELLMDRTFDREYADLRERLEARRRGRDPLTRLLRRLLGMGLKRRQYERGRAFFEAVADERGVAAAGRVWDNPANLPSRKEIDDPSLWLARVA